MKYNVKVLNKNLNPKENVTPDCMIRSLSTLLNKQWRDVFIDLAAIALPLYEGMSSKLVVSEFLKPYGYEMYRNEDKKYSVGMFLESHQDTNYVIVVGEHYAPFVDGVLVDHLKYDTDECIDDLLSKPLKAVFYKGKLKM